MELCQSQGSGLLTYKLNRYSTGYIHEPKRKKQMQLKSFSYAKIVWLKNEALYQISFQFRIKQSVILPDLISLALSLLYITANTIVYFVTIKTIQPIIS